MYVPCICGTSCILIFLRLVMLTYTIYAHVLIYYILHTTAVDQVASCLKTIFEYNVIKFSGNTGIYTV